jgi:toxin ParE1/3/4
MSRRLILRPVAQAEFDEATDWYEQKKAGLGVDFVTEINRVLETIRANPARFPVVCNDVREAIASIFPSAVYYRVKSDRIMVLAVFHSARDPNVWQQRT